MDTFSISFVSIYSHIIAIKEITGRDAKIAAISELFLDTSEIAMMSKTVIAIFKM